MWSICPCWAALFLATRWVRSWGLGWRLFPGDRTGSYQIIWLICMGALGCWVALINLFVREAPYSGKAAQVVAAVNTNGCAIQRHQKCLAVRRLQTLM